MSSPTASSTTSTALAAARKRPRLAAPSSSSSDAALSLGVAPRSSCSACPLLQSDLSSVQSNLERSESLRSIDRRRSEQLEARLRRQITFVTEEGEELRSLLDEVRTRSDADLEKAGGARRDALRRLAESEGRCVQLEAERDEEMEEAELIGRENELLRARLVGVEEEVERLREQVLKGDKGGRGGGKAAQQAMDQDGDDGDDDDYADEDEEEVYQDDEDEEVVVDLDEAGEEEGGGIGAPPSRPTATPVKVPGGADSSEQREAAPEKQSNVVELLSPAPPAVLTELNRTRIKLAESERTNRQLNRKLTTLQSVADTAVRHREEVRSAKSKLERLEGELGGLSKEREVLKATEGRWAEFRTEIGKAFRDSSNDDVDVNNHDDKDDKSSGSSNRNTPPEVATVLRRFDSLRTELQGLAAERTNLRTELTSANRRIVHLEDRLSGTETASSTFRTQRQQLEERAKKAELDVRKIKVQESVWKREADSLRKLVETYEGLEGRMVTKPANSSGGGAKVAVGGEEDGGPTVRALRTSLTSAQSQVQLLQTECATLKTDAETAGSKLESVTTELSTVKTKFGKLRDALYKERTKAEEAEQRAVQAETMAGKGYFDADAARVVHLRDNPLMRAVRAKYEAEIGALRKALEEKTEEHAGGRAAGMTPLPSLGGAGRTPPSAGGGAAGGGGSAESTASALDAQKLHRRLKESFREQIGKFREGVYLLTGYKIDMMTDPNPSNPVRFKVRSVYAERESDHLLFSWPNKKGNKEQQTAPVTMLDLLDTEQGQLLSRSPSFAYMTKYKSLPGFLASVQLELFETQTTMFAG